MKKHKRGNSLVEFVLVIPFFWMSVMGAFCFAALLYQQHRLEAVSHHLARYLALFPEKDVNELLPLARTWLGQHHDRDANVQVRTRQVPTKFPDSPLQEKKRLRVIEVEVSKAASMRFVSSEFHLKSHAREIGVTRRGENE